MYGLAETKFSVNDVIIHKRDIEYQIYQDCYSELFYHNILLNLATVSPEIFPNIFSLHLLHSELLKIGEDVSFSLSVCASFLVDLLS